MMRELLSYLPQNNLDDAPRRLVNDPADRGGSRNSTHIVPAESNQALRHEGHHSARGGRRRLL